MPFLLFAFTIFFVPFNSCLVQYRLAYYPKRAAIVQCDVEAATPNLDNGQHQDDSTAKVVESEKFIDDVVHASEPSANSSKSNVLSDGIEIEEAVPSWPTLWGVGKRLQEKEGRPGLLKGLFPTIVVSFLTTIFSYRFISRCYISPSPSTAGQGLQSSLICTLFYSVALIWVYRSIATRYKLEVFGNSIKDGVGALITRYERAKFWKAYSNGFLFALLAGVLLRVLVVRPLYLLIGADLGHPDMLIHNSLRVASLLFLLVSTILLAPLDVIVTRLAAQPNHGKVAAAPETDAADDVAARLHTMPNTICFRHDTDLEPYKNPYDCAAKIVREEGWGVLYRGWFMTFLSTIFL